MAESELRDLLREINPNGNLQAVVETDGRTVYLCLVGSPESGLEDWFRPVWIRNLVPAPESFAEQQERGGPPLLPIAFCTHPQGGPLPDPADLRLGWLAEGDSVALYERDELLGVVPGWVGRDGCPGYARDCQQPSPAAWPLEAGLGLEQRFAAARETFARWQGEPGGELWRQLQGAQLGAYEQELGPHDGYYAIDGGYWPPKAIVRWDRPDASILVTLGMCIRPQPRVEVSADQPERLRRIELGLALGRREGTEDAAFEAELLELSRWLAGSAEYPWARYTWLGHRHTYPTQGYAPGPDGPYEVVVWDRQPPQGPEVMLPPYEGDPVNVLWARPLTAREGDWAAKEGSGPLVEALAAAGHGWVHRPRPGVR